MTKNAFIRLLKQASDSDEFIKFENVAPYRRMATRKDLDAFLRLELLVPNENRDLIGCAEHDQIWLDVDIEKLANVASHEDILDLVRCGVWYEDGAGLTMHV